MAVGVLDARALPAWNQEHALVGLEEAHPGLHEGDRPPVVEPHQKLVGGELDTPVNPEARRSALAHVLDGPVEGNASSAAITIDFMLDSVAGRALPHADRAITVSSASNRDYEFVIAARAHVSARPQTAPLI